MNILFKMAFLVLMSLTLGPATAGSGHDRVNTPHAVSSDREQAQSFARQMTDALVLASAWATAAGLLLTRTRAAPAAQTSRRGAG